VDQSVAERLRKCPYPFVFRKVSYHFEHGRLTLLGCVPSYYFKQVLQELLRDTDHVECIRNEVEVVSSSGLASAMADGAIARSEMIGESAGMQKVYRLIQRADGGDQLRRIAGTVAGKRAVRPREGVVHRGNGRQVRPD
jgi:hypothetical protein